MPVPIHPAQRPPIPLSLGAYLWRIVLTALILLALLGQQVSPAL